MRVTDEAISVDLARRRRLLVATLAATRLAAADGGGPALAGSVFDATWP